MSTQLVPPGELILDRLFKIFTSAGMDATLENGELVVTSHPDVGLWFGGEESNELVQLGPYRVRVLVEDWSAAGDHGATHIVFTYHTQLDGAQGDMPRRLHNFANRINAGQPFVKASSLDNETLQLDWYIPVIFGGISEQCLISAITVFFHELGSIQAGEYN
jgi:hypothetical protein